ncbi:hypothetical protein RvY_01954-2 [Ramazzottius varieornatus]|uniref:Uncharacterized protein n=1 Tax=Ramazzottius varieornatus TaxID=947166 RepID=A0A1D1ULH8_RAMVA|nr:hypothetical protein RvY_01954-2 [Ramazzottius varieornatus]
MTCLCWVVSFTPRIVDAVRSLADGIRKEDSCVSRSTSITRMRRIFASRPTRGCKICERSRMTSRPPPSMPPLLCHIEPKQLQSFIVWKNDCSAK